MRWAAAPIAVSRHWRDDGVEEAGGRRPRVPARRVGVDGPTPLEAGFRRGKAPEGRPRGREPQRSQASNDVCELELNLAAIPMNPSLVFSDPEAELALIRK